MTTALDQFTATHAPIPGDDFTDCCGGGCDLCSTPPDVCAACSYTPQGFPRQRPTLWPCPHAPVTCYLVKFHRVANNTAIAPLDFAARDAGEIAEQVHRYVGRHIASALFAVTVDIKHLRGEIDFGTLGTFTITPKGDQR